MRYITTAFLTILMLAVACTGPVGPEGPAGVPGDTGPAGPGTRLVLTCTLDSAGAAVELLATVGTITNPPLVGCYVSTDGNAWYVIGNSQSEALMQCILEQGDAGNVRVRMRTSQPETYYGKQYTVVAVS